MNDSDWYLLKRSVRTRFPKVRWIATKELANWLADPARKQPTLFDVRTANEWTVSHLPGARRVDPHSIPENVLQDIPRGAPLVVYSSVGYRSAAFATRAEEAGFTSIVALEGSIFQWANERRPLVSEHGSPVSRVHPYNPFWIGLLADDVRAPLDQTSALQS